MKSIYNEFSIYSDNNKELIKKTYILFNPNGEFIIKEKNKFTLEKFNSLNKKRKYIPN